MGGFEGIGILATFPKPPKPLLFFTADRAHPRELAVAALLLGTKAVLDAAEATRMAMETTAVQVAEATNAKGTDQGEVS